eukprot:CAMPEP_0114976104 /NCGR_PEP_ID=MMETSP0216-20121206/2478_1 /TAXON_ID=223996 /ORGANISM="Protocruzia adherens, Strain Boccale" /LENGTH=275 /DNA_ID=CAMNT_0002336977 /DNA_START=111 /DNA_END=939 /DNA_ORIENTATION=+
MADNPEHFAASFGYTSVTTVVSEGHDIDLFGRPVRIFDAPGLNDADSTIPEWHQLLLEKCSIIHVVLLVFDIRNLRITASQILNGSMLQHIVDKFDSKSVIIVFTHYDAWKRDQDPKTLKAQKKEIVQGFHKNYGQKVGWEKVRGFVFSDRTRETLERELVPLLDLDFPRMETNKKLNKQAIAEEYHRVMGIKGFEKQVDLLEKKLDEFKKQMEEIKTGSQAERLNSSEQQRYLMWQKAFVDALAKVGGGLCDAYFRNQAEMKALGWDDGFDNEI